MQERSYITREILGFAVFAVGLFMVLALFSYSPADPPGATVFPVNERVLNKCGLVGAAASTLCFNYVGVVSTYLLAALLVGWGLMLFFKRAPKTPGLRLAAWLFVLLVLCSFEALALRPGAFSGRLSGGFVGVFLSHRVLLVNFNFAGAFLVMAAAGIVAFLVATDFAPVRLAGAVGRIVRRPEPEAEEEEKKPRARKPKKPKKIDTEEETPDGKDDKLAQVEERKKRIEALLKRKEAEAAAQPDAKKDVEETIKARGEEKALAEGYRLPPPGMLDFSASRGPVSDEEIIRRNSEILEKTLADFNVQAEVVEIERGPVVTLYELNIGAGIKVSKIAHLSDNIAMALKAQSVRIIAPIPGKSAVGVEVPNAVRDIVRLRGLIEDAPRKLVRQHIPLFLGMGTKGDAITGDLTKLPHLLIAGETGSGKSVCINSIILSILFTRKPNEVKLILIDPKRVELSVYEDIPHLLHPVVTDMKKAQAVLEWAMKKMDDRYKLFEAAGVNYIKKYNALPRREQESRVRAKMPDVEVIPKRLPFIVIIIDELADMMMVASKEIETAITRLMQKSRAVGIHMIIATQRPSVDVITGLIKSNMPSRIAFRVLTGIDSNTILGRRGAEKLLGQGDMLFSSPGMHHLIRAQGTFVADNEIRKTVDFVKNLAQPEFSEELAEWKPAESRGGRSVSDQAGGGASLFGEPVFAEAVELFLRESRASITLLQMRLKIGYAHAARIVDAMEQAGILGPHSGSKPREILITPEEWAERKSSVK
jgi:S-DNA-T family DNA segregation ATPase FtsK/SpoIIIE